MLDFASPHDEDPAGSDEDSNISIAVRNSESDPTGSDGRDTTTGPSRVSSHRLAVQRARYFRRKYAVERGLAIVLFCLVSPLIVLLIALIRMTSRGPGIYRQKRVGLHGETFDVLKLRSMYVDAEVGGKPVWATKKDRRITPLGRFLRKSHLDELPQLWNVIRGEMALTGPRPERPQICEVLVTFIDDYYHRNAVKPGVTGLAQINLEPDETIADVKRKQYLDMHYIENANAWLDLRMLAATCLRVFGIKGDLVMKTFRLCRSRELVDGVVIHDSENRKLFPGQGNQACCSRSETARHRFDGVRDEQTLAKPRWPK